MTRGASANDGFVEIGRTGVIQNSLNPEWQEKIRINYFFEVKQPLRFEVYVFFCFLNWEWFDHAF